MSSNQLWLLFRAVRSRFMTWLIPPERQIEHALSRLSRDILAAGKALVKVGSEFKALEAQQRQLQAQMSEWEQAAAEHLHAGNEANARLALQKQLEVEQVLEGQSLCIERLRPAVTRLRQRYEHLQAQKRGLLVRKNMLAARESVAEAEARVARVIGGIGSPSGAPDFRQMEDELQVKEAEAQALQELASESFLQEPGARESVEERLARLKHRVATEHPVEA